MMKPLVCTLMLLLGCTFFSAHPAQNSADSDEEREKQIKECETPDREKPKGEIKRVSQLCGHALSLPKPPYPEEAKSSQVAGTVVVDIVTNPQGSVIWAKAVSGPELLRRVSEKAACRARYSPTLISGRAIPTESSIQYHFEFR